MKRLIPSSLLGQVMASVTLALLVAQIISATLLYRAGNDRREAAMLTAAAFLLVNGDELARAARNPERRGPPRRRTRQDRGVAERANALAPRPRNLPRRLRYVRSDQAPISAGEAGRDSGLEGRLRTLLEAEGIVPRHIAVMYRRAGDDPAIAAFAQNRPRFDRIANWRDTRVLVAAMRVAEGGGWETARVAAPPAPRGGPGLLIMQTLVILVVLIAILYLVLRRITRPLAVLTGRVSDFSQRPDQAVMLPETGPSDTRRLIAAHNTMEARIAALLDEKDVMLGAIGHDLKTPLAALRVRIESVPDEAQRARMSEQIEDITRTLDDILALARVSRGRVGAEGREAVDMAALAASIVEEFEDLGEPVTFDAPQGEKRRFIAIVQETWVKRALRNLVSNAVRYGGAASISVTSEVGNQGDAIVLRVEDEGPGIEADRIADMLEPFTRGDVSRNRATGGAGLGLTLARAIAEAHGGKLVLVNREQGGMRAEIRLPLG